MAPSGKFCRLWQKRVSIRRTRWVVGQDVLVSEDALKNMGHGPFNHGRADICRAEGTATSSRNLPDIFLIGGYDGTQGDRRGTRKGLAEAPDAPTAAARGMSWDSPRGPVSIDPATRDIVLTVYIQKVQKTAVGLRNVVIDKFERVKDPEK